MSRLPDLAAIVVLIASYSLLHHYLDKQGMFFVMTPLKNFWQVLDPKWLYQDLLQSLIHLHAQPPLLNLLIGIGLHQQFLPLDQFFHVIFQALAVGILLLLFANLRLLKTPWWLAMTLSLLWMVYPAFIYYQHFLFYPILVQFLLLLALFSLGLGISGSALSLAAFFLVIALLFLTRSTYNLLFVVLITALVIGTRRREWKRLLLLAAPGLTIVLAFTIKNVILFQQFSTSSWLGMNLANVAITGIALEDRQRLVDQGAVSQLVLVGPFEDISAYPKAVWEPFTRDCRAPEALCQPKKTNQDPNMNYSGYIPVSNTFLRDDLTLLLRFPGNVLKQVGMGWRIYFSPSLVTVFVNKRSIQPIQFWRDWSDQFLCGDIKDIYTAEPCHRLQALYFGVLFLAAGTFLFRLKNRSTSPAERVMILYSILTLLYSMAVGILFDLGENNRFRLETDPLMVILLGYSLAHAVNSLFRHFQPGKQPTATSS